MIHKLPTIFPCNRTYSMYSTFDSTFYPEWTVKKIGKRWIIKDYQNDQRNQWRIHIFLLLSWFYALCPFLSPCLSIVVLFLFCLFHHTFANLFVVERKGNKVLWDHIFTHSHDSHILEISQPTWPLKVLSQRYFENLISVLCKKYPIDFFHILQICSFDYSKLN